MFYLALIIAAIVWEWAMGLAAGAVMEDGSTRSLLQGLAVAVTVGALLLTVWVVDLA